MHDQMLMCKAFKIYFDYKQFIHFIGGFMIPSR